MFHDAKVPRSVRVSVGARRSWNADLSQNAKPSQNAKLSQNACPIPTYRLTLRPALGPVMGVARSARTGPIPVL